MATIDELLKRKLQEQVPVKGKEGKTMEAQEAMVNALLANAMKGDIASIAFIRNITKTVDPEKEQEAHEVHVMRVADKVSDLICQLKEEDAYDGQDTEITLLAEKAIFVADLDTMISASDFQAVTTDPRTGKQTVSPLIGLRDSQHELFEKQLAKLRQDATNRKIMKKNMR